MTTFVGRLGSLYLLKSICKYGKELKDIQYYMNLNTVKPSRYIQFRFFLTGLVFQSLGGANTLEGKYLGICILLFQNLLQGRSTFLFSF